MTNPAQTFFQPWVGEFYFNDYLGGKKLLVVTDSHYVWDVDKKDLIQSGFTQVVVQDYIQGKAKHKIWQILLPLFGINTKDHSERHNFFHSIAVHTYAQRAMDKTLEGKIKRPTEEDIPQANQAFIETINKIKPDAVLILGIWVWKALESIQHTSELHPSLLKQSQIRLYKINDHEFYAYGIRHPSRFFKRSLWEKNLKYFRDNFLDRK